MAQDWFFGLEVSISERLFRTPPPTALQQDGYGLEIHGR